MDIESLAPARASDSTSGGHADRLAPPVTSAPPVTAPPVTSHTSGENDAVAAGKESVITSEHTLGGFAEAAPTESGNALALERRSQAGTNAGEGGEGAREHTGEGGDYLQPATAARLRPGCPVVVGNDSTLMLGTVVGRAEDGRYQVETVALSYPHLNPSPQSPPPHSPQTPPIRSTWSAATPGS